jgi:hypothetical protein
VRELAGQHPNMGVSFAVLEVQSGETRTLPPLPSRRTEDKAPSAPLCRLRPSMQSFAVSSAGCTLSLSRLSRFFSVGALPCSS